MAEPTLPMPLPEPCPICGKNVYLYHVDEWETESGKVVHFEMECESEPPMPDLESEVFNDEWDDWFNGHYSMPYVDWMPYEYRMLDWLNQRYRYDGEGKLIPVAAPPQEDKP